MMKEQKVWTMARSKPRKQTRQIACVALFSALMLLFGGPAFAKEKVVTLSEVTIVGRVQKPIAAVGVSKIQPKLTLSELKQSFADRIERALYHSPF